MKPSKQDPALPERTSWLTEPASVDEFVARLRVLGLGAYEAGLVGLVRESARLVHSNDSVFPLGGTRLGGEPDLADGHPWPAGPDGPLSFILQLDLAEVTALQLAENPLPDAGMLSFFYDAVELERGSVLEDRDSWAVVYTAEGEILSRRPFPASLDEVGRFDAVALSLQREITFPAAESFDVAALGPADDLARYGEVLGDVPDAVTHRVLGNPQQIQGDMQAECALASGGVPWGSGVYAARPESQRLLQTAVSWRLLLQVDSDATFVNSAGEPTPRTGMMWGDVGRLYFWMRDIDLADREWDEAWVVLQCS